MAKRPNIPLYLAIGFKLLAAIAGAELLIMLLAGWLQVERWLTPLQFDFVDTSLLGIAASFVTFYWVIRPLKASSKTIGEYQQLEETLRASERQYRNLFDNNPQPMFIYDRETLSLLAVNAAAVDHYGYSREEFLAMTVKDLYRPEDRPAVVDAISRIPGEIRRPGVWRQKKKDGTLIDVDVVTHDLVFSGRAARHTLINDVTGRKKAEAILKESEEKYRLIFSNSPIGIFNYDAMLRITDCNEYFADLVKTSKREVIGLNMEQLKDKGVLPALRDALENREGFYEGQYFAKTLPGGIRISLHTAPLYGSEGAVTGGVGIVEDITGRKRAEEQIRTQMQRLSALHSVDIAISSSLDIRLTLDIFLEQVIDQLHVDAACVLLLKPHSKLLEFASHRGFRTQALKHTRIRLGQGNAGIAALKRSIVHVPDVKSDEEFNRVPNLADEQFVSYYAVPLIAKGEVKGVLEIFHRSPLHPDRGWQDFLESLALQAAIAIDNAALFESLERSHLDLVTAYDSTIEGWSRALDYRDKETEGHSKRVTELTIKVCRAVGMGERDLAYVRWGALLHDIGKLGVPDEVLFKPGKLDDEEWKIMKRHPVLAYELLQPIRYLGPAVDIPYCHHEKWDGAGYPQGLQGEQIPLAARIFSIVDVWDALGSDRPYRSAWPKEKIVQYLNDRAGKDFDPRVTDIFLKLLGEGAMSDVRLSVGKNI